MFFGRFNNIIACFSSFFAFLMMMILITTIYLLHTIPFCGILYNSQYRRLTIITSFWHIDTYQSKTPRNAPVVQVGSTGLCNKRVHMSWGAVFVSKIVLKRIYRIWPVLGDLGEGSRRQGFAIGWMLSVSRNNRTIGYLDKSYLGGKTKVVIDKEASATLINQEGGNIWSSPFSLHPRFHPIP